MLFLSVLSIHPVIKLSFYLLELLLYSKGVAPEDSSAYGIW